MVNSHTLAFIQTPWQPWHSPLPWHLTAPNYSLLYSSSLPPLLQPALNPLPSIAPTALSSLPLSPPCCVVIINTLIQLSWYMTGVSFIACCRAETGGVSREALREPVPVHASSTWYWWSGEILSERLCIWDVINVNRGIYCNAKLHFQMPFYTILYD